MKLLKKYGTMVYNQYKAVGGDGPRRSGLGEVPKGSGRTVHEKGIGYMRKKGSKLLAALLAMSMAVNPLGSLSVMAGSDSAVESVFEDPEGVSASGSSSYVTEADESSAADEADAKSANGADAEGIEGSGSVAAEGSGEDGESVDSSVTDGSGADDLEQGSSDAGISGASGSLESEDEEIDANSAISMMTNDVLLGDGEASTDGSQIAKDNQWGFEARYLNEASDHQVRKDSDFNLKYQIAFHSSREIAPGAAAISVPRSLMKTRGGSPTLPHEIAVPEITLDGLPQNRAASKTKIIEWLVGEEKTLPNRTPFDYFVWKNPETGEEELVFFNYDKVTSGTNAIWQITYKDIGLSNYVDETTWELPVEATVYESGTDDVVDYETTTPDTKTEKLRGSINTYVRLDSVSKEPLTSGKSYTPGLYTKSQVKRYASNPTADGSKILSSDDEFENYRYVAWKVHVSGRGNQPWNLKLIEETAKIADADGTKGIIVGYSSALGVDKIIASGSGDSWSRTINVVAAYPKDKVTEKSETQEGTKLENHIEVELIPADGLDPRQRKSADAEWYYMPYSWRYGYVGVGNAFNKWNTDGTNDHDREIAKAYPGLLREFIDGEAEESSEVLPFSIQGSMYGFHHTHDIDPSSAKLGQYKEGTYYKVTMADDLLYARPTKNGLEVDGEGNQLLNQDDYYFASVRIHRQDIGMDVWEDEIVAPESTDSVNQDIDIYVMYADKPNEWVKLEKDKDYTTPSNILSGTYDLTANALVKKPYRVKAEYKSINYRTSCRIDVGVRLKNSEKIKQIINTNIGNVEEGKDRRDIDLTNIGGISASAYDAAGKETARIFDGSDDQATTVFDREYFPGIKDWESSHKYGDNNDRLLFRDAVKKRINDIVPTADAFKTSSTRNDTVNGRVLVNYNLTATDGYLVYNEKLYRSMGTDRELSPGKNQVAFYDLLPSTVEYDLSYRPIAGRITNFGSSYQTQPKSWNSDNVTVTVGKDDIIPNWRGTGRTMVIFHLTYNGDDPSVYSNRKWAEGWGVSFRAYYSWDDKERNKGESTANTNLMAFVSETRVDNKFKDLVDVPGKTYTDDGQDLPNDTLYQEFFKPEEGKTEQKINGTISEPSSVIFAKNWAGADPATSGSDKITKQIRADRDIPGDFSYQTTVKTEEAYTYKLTVNAANGLDNLVIFDRLEMGREEARDGTKDGEQITVFSDMTKDFDELEKTSWKGTFVGVDLEEAKARGIKPVVYYSANSYAKLPDRNTNLGADYDLNTKVLSEANGWYTQEQWEAADKTPDQVKAVAFDLRKLEATDDEGKQKDFRLNENQAISVYIKMKAPTDVPTSVWAYNIPSYYSRTIRAGKDGSDSEGSDTYPYVIGNITRLRLAKELKSVEVEKKFGDNKVPESRKNERFTFELRRDGKALTNQRYELWERSSPSAEPRLIDRRGTNEKGRFDLEAGQIARFTDLKADWEMNADGSTGDTLQGIEIYEVESPFWEQKITTTKTEAQNEYQQDLLHYTVENNYRPVVYVQKQLNALPKDMQQRLMTADSQKKGKDLAYTFRFRITKDDETSYGVPLEYWYVSEARTDGTTPSRMAGKPKSNKTDKDGYFTLRSDEILALFLPKVGGYKITEVDAEGNPIAAGKIVTNGTKTEKVLVEKDGKTETKNVESRSEDWIAKQPSVTGKTDDNGTSETLVNTYRWKDLVLTKNLTHQSAVEAAGQKFTFTLYRLNGDKKIPVGKQPWVLEKAADNTLENDKSGTTDANGNFTLTMPNQVIRIEHLESGQKYVVEENLTDEQTKLYTAESGGKTTVTMPKGDVLMKRASITNDYRLRDLKVTKTVVQKGGAGTTASFTFKLERKESADDSAFTPYGGADFKVTKNGQIVRQGKTDSDGSFKLFAGETAVFKDFGINEQCQYQVTETNAGGLVALIPANGADGKPVPLSGTLSGDNTTASFINGDQGILIVGKQYIAGADDEQNRGQQVIGEGKLEKVKLLLQYRRKSKGTWTNLSTAKDTFTVQKLSENGQIETAAFDGDGTVLTTDKERYLISGNTGVNISNYEFRITEKTEDYIIYDETTKGYIFIGQSDPADHGSIQIRNVNENPSAVIVNEVRGLPKQSSIYKKVLPTTVVPSGMLSFVVERYTGSGWTPAKGVPYFLTEDDKHQAEALSKTDESGQLIMTAMNGKIPRIVFPSDTVTINPAKPTKGSLRIRELFDAASDWGMLIGYEKSETAEAATAPKPTEAAKKEETDPLSALDQDTFVNETRRDENYSKIRIGKRMKEEQDSGETEFTFRLSQITQTDQNGKPIESVPASNLSYLIRDNNGASVGIGSTEADGTFCLKADQIAEFDVKYGTQWLGEELQNQTGYCLEKMALNDNELDDTSANYVSATSAKLGIEAAPKPKERRSAPLWRKTLNPNNNQGLEDYCSRYTTTEIYFGSKDDPQYAEIIKNQGENFAGEPGPDSELTSEIQRYVVGDKVYILADAGVNIQLPADMSYAFARSYLRKVVFGDNIDTSKLTNMKALFTNNMHLMTIEGLEKFDVSNVKTFDNLFDNNYNLRTIGKKEGEFDLKAWNTGNATSMVRMFYNCSYLTSLDLGNWDTNNVKDMSHMFYYCKSLKNLDVKNWNTNKLTQMNYMFEGCSNLEQLDLSGWNTAEVIDMSRLFASCSKLKEIVFGPNWNVGKVKFFNNFFNGCTNLEKDCLHLEKWDTNSAVNMSGMFMQTNFTSLDLSNFDTKKVADMSSMFSNCVNLESLNLSSFDTSNVRNMTSMFYYCSSLTDLDVSNFDTSSVTNMHYMFGNMKALKKLDLSKFNTVRVENMNYMFNGDEKLEDLKIANFNTQNVKGMESMFKDCKALKHLDVSNFNTKNVTTMANMFSSCEALKSLDISSFDTAKVKYMNGMFMNCKALEELKVDPEKFIRKDSSVQQMYANAGKNLSLDLRGFAMTETPSYSDVFSGANLNEIIISDKWTGCSLNAAPNEKWQDASGNILTIDQIKGPGTFKLVS